ncbi:MAG: hypothetical protein HQL88_10305 [Magnetococcales bacterium]|nr:hypothetical protein [Magnetococcales bacterium]
MPVTNYRSFALVLLGLLAAEEPCQEQPSPALRLACLEGVQQGIALMHPERGAALRRACPQDPPLAESPAAHITPSIRPVPAAQRAADQTVPETQTALIIVSPTTGASPPTPTRDSVPGPCQGDNPPGPLIVETIKKEGGMGSGGGGSPPPPGMDETMIKATQTVPTAHAAPPPRHRLEAGIGYAHGRHDGRFSLRNDGTLALQESPGGSGLLLRLAWWRDGVASKPSLSTGLEYLHLHNTYQARIGLPKGVGVLADPIEGQVDLEVEGHLLFVNLLHRTAMGPQGESFIGAGLGAGVGSASGHYALRIPLLNPMGRTDSVTSWVGGVQGIGGFAIPLAERLYWQLQGRVLWLPGQAFGIDQHYLNMSVESSLGLFL